MKELRFEDLYEPEYYHEIPNFDSRIAIRKFLDARSTMGFAKASLSYIEPTSVDDLEKNFVKSIHLRHALLDLNNSFDLLLQIPWLYYRAWKEFNKCGTLRSKYGKNRENIVRNSTDWVYKAERECSDKKLLIYLNSRQSPLKQKIEDFQNKYIRNDEKEFTVRTLCNTMKHNHELSFQELYEPYEFNVNLNGMSVNCRENDFGAKLVQEFYDEDKPDEILGAIKTNYVNDLEIDIEYKGGDVFRFIDCTHHTDRYRISYVLKECTDYYNAIIDLFEDIYEEIYPNIMPCLSLSNNQKSNIKKGNSSIDLNKYFTKC